MPPSALAVFCKKTQICKFYQKNKCKRGQECTFAHSSEELRAPPDLRCTRLCHDVISKGRCADTQCRFAHVRVEVRRLAVPRASKDSWACEPTAVKVVVGQVTPQRPFLRTVPVGAGALPANVAPSQQPLPVSMSEMAAEGEPEATLDPSAASVGVFSQSTTPGDGSLDSFSRWMTEDSSPPWTSPESSPVDSELASSQGDSGAGDAASDNDTAAPKVRGMRNWFHKTRMCRFHVEGHCGKGHACSFAHGQTELRPLPDLTCMKLCPRLLHTGVCDMEGCTFAHSREELHSSPEAKERLPAARGMLAAAAAAVACAATERREHDPLGALDWSRICVKHTFLELQEDKELSKPYHRSRSVPCRLSRDEPQPGECAKAGMPTQSWRSQPPLTMPARSFRCAPVACSGRVPIVVLPQ